MTATFKKRTFELVFRMGVASQFKDGSDEIRIKGLRAAARLTMYPQDGAHAVITVYGLSKDLINRLMTLKGSYMGGNRENVNYVAINSLDEVPNLVFQGGIMSALADFNSAPEIGLTIEASSYYRAQLLAVPAKTWNGTVPVATIMSDLAIAGGMNFVNLGVNSSLTDESVNGSVMDMIRKVAQDANIVFHVAGEGITLYIAPSNLDDIQKEVSAQRAGERRPLVISTENGMVGWPTPTLAGCEVKCIYSPDFRLMSSCTVKCPDIKMLDDSEHRIVKIQHSLQTEQDGGDWFSDLSLQRKGR